MDDAIVVMENITRHLEAGMAPFAAALKGAEEIGFTVFSISISLIAVFIPILMMGGIVGRLFREFAVTLSTAILVSMVISLTTTPMMCAYLLKDEHDKKHGRLYIASERFFDWMLSLYRRSLEWVLDNPAITLIVLVLTIALNVVARHARCRRAFFRSRIPARSPAACKARRIPPITAMNNSIQPIGKVIKGDPGGRQRHRVHRRKRRDQYRVHLYIASNRSPSARSSALDVINRLRPKLNHLPVASAFLQASQDLRIGGRSSNALYQYTLQSDSAQDLAKWGPILLAEMKKLPGLQDVNSDQQNGGRDELLTYDRVTAAKLGLTVQSLDSALYSAFGQSEVSVIYTQLNQYYVVLEVAPQYWQTPAGFNDIYLASSGNEPHPAFRRCEESVEYDPAGDQSHRLVSLGHGFLQSRAGRLAERCHGAHRARCRKARARPRSIHGFFAGTLLAYQQSLRARSRSSSSPRCSPCTSFSGFCTRTSCTPSRSSRPCLPRAWARCWH